MIRRAIALGLAMAPFALSPAGAAIEDDTVMVPLFVEACATGTPSAEAIEARMSGNAAWQRIADSDLAVEEFGTVKSMQPIGDFKKPAGYKQWRRTAGGKEVRVVLASFEGKGRYRNLCALLVPDVKNALPFMHPFRDAMRALGLKGKSIDLVHYEEFSGKLADGRKARGDIFSRTRVLEPGDNMHMYVAF